jgi:uncharacterized membrane protein YkvI
MLGSLSVLSNESRIRGLFLLCLATVIATFGFSNIVNSFYPVLGFTGAAVLFIYIVKIALSQKNPPLNQSNK